jgi:hypothetical protein
MGHEETASGKPQAPSEEMTRARQDETSNTEDQQQAAGESQPRNANAGRRRRAGQRNCTLVLV